MHRQPLPADVANGSVVGRIQSNNDIIACGRFKCAERPRQDGRSDLSGASQLAKLDMHRGDRRHQASLHTHHSCPPHLMAATVMPSAMPNHAIM
jgi:hypothetical protein